VRERRDGGEENKRERKERGEERKRKRTKGKGQYECRGILL
jgi:hypothetical protein